ncbi:PqqD family protein [Paenibacillus piri]|uniref:PqqD family protein n=1 Tax=Paenibacillus piri TaxID=2547395 RepID=A0A4R5KWA3_9BACL|nr:PqqD family protein [Paenibacillus piri]TDG00292.1 PqqD family protein [Paenibacillus piri]
MSQQYRRSMNVEAVEVENEWMILHADQYTVTKLNEVGGLCWELLKEERSVQALAEEMGRQYDVAAQETEQDIESFLEELLKLGLVEHAN